MVEVSKILTVRVDGGDPIPLVDLVEAWQNAHPVEEAKSETVEDASAVVEMEMEGVDEQIAEEDRGSILMLGEGAVNGYSGPVVMDMAMIEPGFGNAKDNHYYPAKTLKDAAHLFEGVKMYLTNHMPKEHTVRNEVAEILKCPVRFTSTGAPVARVGVFDAAFAENVRNRDRLGTLANLQCSILGSGRVRKDAVDEGGRKGHLVEEILGIKTVDFVPRAGAGGRVLGLVEMEDNTVEKQTEVTEEEKKVEDTVVEEAIQEDAQPQALDSSVVLPLLMGSDLPAKTQKRLAEKQWFSTEDVQGAIQNALDIVAEIKGAALVEDMGESTETPKAEEKPLAERETEAIRAYGLMKARA